MKRPEASTIPFTITKKIYLIICLLVYSAGIIAQPQLIPEDAGNNVYPILVIDDNQQIIAIELTEVVNWTAGGTWTIRIGATTLTAPNLLGPIGSGTNTIQFQYTPGFDFDDFNVDGITVAYAGDGDIQNGSSQPLLAFGPVNAVNNLPPGCDMFKLDFGHNITTIAECSPAIMQITPFYRVKGSYVNSMHYDASRITMRIYWGDGTDSEEYGAEVTPNSGDFSFDFVHTYPDDPTSCTWSANIRVGIGGIGYCDGGGLRQYVELLNHTTDDRGNAVLTMNEDTIYVCVGQSFSEVLTDATIFNCNPLLEPDFPNDGERKVRFVYGTNYGAGNRISDVLIDGNIEAFPYIGTIITYDSIRVNGIPAPGYASSLDISHIGNPGTDNVGDIFEITIENWNPCNPYLGGFGTPRRTQAYIKIIDGPLADAGPDDSVCDGDTYDLDGAITGPVGPTAQWSTTDGDGVFSNATSAPNASYTPGSNDASTGWVWLTLTATDGGSGCPEHSDSLLLTVDPLPAQPTITVTGPSSFCFDGGSTSVQLTSSLSPNGNYTWYQDNAHRAAYDGQQSIVLDQVSHTGTWEVVVYGPAPNNCDSQSAGVDIYIDIPPTATTSASQAICGDLSSSTNLQGNTGGTDLSNGATGIWSIPTVWYENFDDLADGTQVDNGSSAWSRTINPDGSGWFSEVRSSRYELADNRTIWTSESIDISSYTNISISMLLASMSTSGFESNDLFDVEYIVDGGLPTSIWSSTGALDGSTNAASRPYMEQTVSASGISGGILVIRIDARNSATNEHYYFDNIVIAEGGAPIISDPTNPTSSVTNLPSGNTTFTWTVSSANGACPDAISSHTVTRWDPPSAADAGSDDDVCEDETTYTLDGNIPVFGTGNWTSGGAAVVTIAGNPNSGVTGLVPGNNNFTWTISNGICPDETDVVTIFRNSPVSPGTLSADQNICEGETPAALTGSAATGGDGSTYTYQWEYSENSNSGPWTTIAGATGTGYSPGALTTTTWYHRLASSGDAGCTTQQDIESTNVIEIYVEPALSPGSISGTQDICLTFDPVAFTSDAPAANSGIGFTYQWYHQLNGGGYGALGGETAEVYDAPDNLLQGTHEYYREARSVTGICSPEQTATVTIVVNPGPTLQVQAMSGDNSKCEDQSITLDYVAVTDATEYVWNFDWVAGDVNATTATPQITIDLSSYTFASPSEVIHVRAAGVNGCNVDSDLATGDYPWSAQHTITVYQNPVADAGGDDDVCGSLAITLAAVPTVGTRTWTDMGTGPGTVGFSNASLATAVATATRYGTYTLEWEEDNGGCVSTDNVSVTFYEDPTVTAPADYGVCDALSTTLNGVGHTYQALSNHSESYLWEYVSGPDAAPVFGSSTSEVTTVTVDYFGTYEFRITETNGSCTDSDIVQVVFSEEPTGAVAGSDINVTCDNLSVNLAATAYSYLGGSNVDAGTRTWSFVSGPNAAVIYADATNPLSLITVPEYGNYVFQWTEINGSCTVSDQVTVKFFEDPAGIAGSGPYTADCDAKVDNITVTAHVYAGIAANHPESTRGWTYFSGPDASPVFSAPTSPNTNVTVSNYGTYVFRWTEANGTCSNYVDVSVTYSENPSLASAGLDLTAICDNKSINLAGTAHGYEAGPSTHAGSTRVWTWVSGPGVAGDVSFTSPTSATSEVVVSYFGPYVFEWTETNGNCTVSDQVTVNFYEDPDGASAGTDVTATCNSYSATLDGTGHTYELAPNDHSTSTSLWTYVSGPGGAGTVSFTDDTDPKTDVTVTYYGTYVLQWTETNGNCTRSDQVTVRFYENPAAATAGSDVTGSCGSLTEALGGTAHVYDGGLNDSSGATRTWAYVSGPGGAGSISFSDATDPATNVTVTNYGTYEFSWTETNGNCSVSETINATFYEAPTVSVDPVADVCRDSTLLLIPISGDFGGGAGSATWSITTGSGVIQNQNTVGSTVTAEYEPAYGDLGGSITLALTTNDPTGPCVPVTSNLIINIDEAVYVVIHEAPSVFIAEGSSANITSTISGAGGTITTGVWTEIGALTGGNFAPSNLTNNITFTPTAAQEASGGVTLRLTSLDPGTSCGTSIAEIDIIIGANPIADAGQDIEDCEPGDSLIYLTGYAKASANDANWSIVTGNGSIIMPQTKTWSAPQSAPHDENDSLLVEAVYKLAPSDYGVPSSGSVFQFLLTTDDPDGAGPVSDDTDDLNYTVHWGPQTPAIGGGGLGNMCTDTYGQFYLVPLSPGNTYTWNIEVLTGGGVEGTDYLIAGGGTGFNFIAIDWLTVATYNLKVTETTYLSDGTTPCIGEEVVKPIAVYEEPVVVAGSDATICVGETHTMNSSVTNGSGSYLYEWTPTTGLSAANVPNPVVTGIFTGTLEYILKITDLVSGCQSISSSVFITADPLPDVYTLSGTEYYCSGALTGVDLTLSDSEADVYYLLMNGAVPVGAAVLGDGNPIVWTDNFDGSYYVEAVRDAVPACSETMAGVVNVMANPIITMATDLVVDVNCFGSNEGIIEITAGGGTSPYTFLWTGPGVFSSSNEDISGLYSGDYTVTITDARGCQLVSAPITITEPAQLALTSVLQTQAVTCYGGTDGEAEVSIDLASGTAPYNIQWYYDMSLSSPVAGATASTLVGVPAATYYVLVTDANMCIVSGSVVITQPVEITGSGAATTPVSCNGDTDAVITVTAAGGSGTLEYDLNNADAWQAGNTFTGLGAGTYTLRVRDQAATTCIISLVDVVITEPDVLTITGLVTSNYNGAEISCPTATDGIITVTGAGGTSAYQYNIDGGPYQAGTAFGTLGAATYTMGIIDARGCTETVPVTITAPTAISGTAVATTNFTGFNVSCNGANDGVIEVTAQDGTGVLEYSLDGGAYQLSNQFLGLGGGTYDITVRDDNGCAFDILGVVVTEPAVLVASASVTSTFNGRDISCNGASDGVVTATAAGGTGVYTYQWFYDAAFSSAVPGGTTDVLNNQPAGTYYVQVTDENGCTDNTGVTINDTPLLVISPTADVLLTCNGDNDATGTFTITGGTTLYNIVIDANTAGATTVINATDVSFTGGSAGVVTITVTDANGCNETSTITITEPTLVTATAAVTSNYNGSDLTCFGASNGIIEVSASGGTGALSYVLNEIPGNTTGAITGIFSGLPSGDYTFTVTDANTCSAVTALVSITDPVQVTASAAITSNYNGSDVSCNGSADGEITVTAAGGTGLLTYTLVEQPGNTTGAASGIFTGVPAGSYTVNVADVNSCSIVTVPVVINNPPAVTGSAAVTSDYNGSDVSCNGSSDGVITVTAGGGTGALSYILNQDPANVTGAANGIFTGISAGIYTITITDLNGCNITTASVVVSNPSAISATAAITSNYNGSHVSCNGSSDGIITVSAFGGTGALSYELVEIPLNVTGAANGIFTGVPAGTYTITVSDLNLCNVTTGAVTINDPVVITASAAVTSNYNGSEVSCFGASDGRITVTASGGTGILTYSLVEMPLNVTGANTGIFSGVPSGVYTVRVTDLNTCNVVTGAVTVDDPPAVTATAAITSNYNGSEVSCNGAADGEITVTAGGGTGTLIYTLVESPGNLTGASTGIFTGVPAGTYTIKATDVNGCNITTASVTIDNPTVIATGAVTSNYNGSDVSCFGSADGAITITAAGGTGTLTYVLNQDAGNVTGSVNGIFTGLIAGNYTVTVTDDNGCNTTTANITVSNPPAITGTAAVTSNYSGSHISCNGASDGIITVTASGGTGALSYELVEIAANVTGAVSGVFTGVPAGTYTVSITDVNTCNIITTPVTVNEPAVITATAAVTSNYNGSELRCNGASDGRIFVTASGGSGALSYVLNEIPTNVSGAATGIFTGLPAGTYTFTVTDANGCSGLTPGVTITPPPALTLTVNITSNYNGSDISCNGSSDGTAQAVVGGGTGAYYYNWYSDAALTIPIGQFTATAANLAAGSYWVRITDVNSCEIVGTVILTEPVALVATETANTPVSCFGGATGSVTVEATAGTGTAPYEYSINGGSTWQLSDGTFNTLPASNYIVLVRDDNGCTVPVNITITQPTQLTASLTGTTNVSCFGAADGEIVVEATAGSGTAGYQYSIDGGTSWQPTGTFSGLSPASYTITVEDANGCRTDIGATITEPPVLELNPTADILLDCFGDIDGTGTFYAVGGTMPYTFTEISNTAGATIPAQGINSQVFFGAGVGEVTFRVTDAKGCFLESTITFTQPAILTSGMIGANDTVCYSDNPVALTEIAAATGGPVGPYTYQWQLAPTDVGPWLNIPGANLADYDPGPAISTQYYRREVRAGICTPEYSNVVVVWVNELPSAFLTGGATICPGETANLKVSLFTGESPYELEIENHGIVSGYISDIDIPVMPGVTTSYKLLRVTDANGCEVLDGSPNLNGSATVVVRELPAITFDPGNATVCEYNLVQFDVSATGDDLAYQWQVDTLGPDWVDLIDGGSYFGANQPGLMIFSATRDLNNYRYRAVVSSCSDTVRSAAAILTVDTPPEFISQPSDSTICFTEGATFEVQAQGTGLTYQWWVNQGTGFREVEDLESNFSGATTPILSIIDAPLAFDNDMFRVVVSGDCGVPIYSSFAILHVIQPPAAMLQPVDQAICDGFDTYLSANGSLYNTIVWQVNDGGGWLDIIDGGNYAGSSSPVLSILGADTGMDQNEYRLALHGDCDTTYTNPAVLTVWDNPVVDFSAVDPLFACGGQDLLMDGNPTGGSLTYTTHRWTGQVGPLSNFGIVDPVFRTTIPGSYALTYTVTDDNMCVGTGNVSVVVEQPRALFTADLTSGCEPLEVNFTDLSIDGVVYRWDFGDGTPIDNTVGDVSHTFTHSTGVGLEYITVNLEVETTNGCTDDYSIGITIYPPSTADFTMSSDTICSGEYVVFSSDPGSALYEWTWGDGQADPGSSVANHLYLHSTGNIETYNVQLVTTSYYGCTDTIVKPIVVYPMPEPTFMDPPDQVYPDATVTFTNTTATPGTWNYEWKFGDGNGSTQTSPTHTYTVPGYYEVWLLASNDHCVDSTYHMFNLMPTPPVVDFDSLPGACAPYTVTMTNNSLYADSYVWEFGDGGVSYAENPTYTYMESGTFRITLTVTGPGGVRSFSRLIEVYFTPRAFFQVAPEFVYVDDEKVRCFNLSEGGSSYIWEFGDGDTSMVADPFHKYMAEGVYDITLHAYSDNGCYDTYTLSPAVTVEPAGELRFANVFRPNKDGELPGDVGGLNSDQIDMVFFPPVKEQVDEYKLQIFNRAGVLIFQSNEINTGWNGYYKGKLVMQGVYVWYVEGKYANGKPFKKKGDITLLH